MMKPTKLVLLGIASLALVLLPRRSSPKMTPTPEKTPDTKNQTHHTPPTAT